MKSNQIADHRVKRDYTKSERLNTPGNLNTFKTNTQLETLSNTNRLLDSGASFKNSGRQPDLLFHGNKFYSNSKNSTSKCFNLHTSGGSQSGFRPNSKDQRSQFQSSSKSRSISQGKNIEIKEDEISIDIPRPYPQNHYMLIEDKRLIDSKYTQHLNKIYPPRKYVKHNETSSNRFQKHNPKSINVKFMNPKLNSIGLEQIHNNLDELSLNSINTFPQALTIIQKLKIKIIEYESANNKNIEVAFQHLKCLEEENEFLKLQLKDSYEKLGKYSERFGDEILNPHVYNIVRKFRKKWASVKLLRFLALSVSKIKFYEQRLSYTFTKKSIELKMKAFLGLQKNYLNMVYQDKMSNKRSSNMVNEIFQRIKINYQLNKRSRVMQKKQKAIAFFIYFTTLKSFYVKSKISKSRSDTAVTAHSAKLKRKSVGAFKFNLLYNIKYGFNPEIRKSESIKFSKYLKERNMTNSSLVKKSKSIRALSLLKTIFLRTHSKLEMKYSYKNKLTTLNKFFDHWKLVSLNVSMNIEFIIRTTKAITSLFFKNCRKDICRKDKETNLKLIHSVVFFKSMKKIIKKKKIRNEVYPQIAIKKHFMSFLQNVMTQSNYNARLKSALIPLRVCQAFGKLRWHLEETKSKVFLRNLAKNVMKRRLEGMHVALTRHRLFKECLSRIDIKNKIGKFRKKYTGIEIFSKTISKLRSVCLLTRIFKIKAYYINFITNLKQVIEEKSSLIFDLENSYSQMNEELSQIETANSNLATENEFLKKKINQLETELESNHEKINLMFDKNVKDIQSLKEVLKNNEFLLESTLKREEKLQNKYQSDVMDAIKLNRELNSLITKKNHEISELSLRNRQKEIVTTEKMSQMQKQSANLHVDYSKYLEIYDHELRQANAAKRSLIQSSNEKISELEEQKLKNEYKAQLLEEENKALQFEYKGNYRSYMNTK